MYGHVKDIVLTAFKAPAEAPQPPSGSHDSVSVFRASPRYLRYRMVSLVVGVAIELVVLGGFFIAALFQHDAALFGGELVLALMSVPAVFLAYFILRVDYDLRYYILTDRSLRVREGAWTVREMTLTYANVQNVRVVQGPLQRLFGIWDLRVDTAGGGGATTKGHSAGHSHSVTLAGVENAHELRDRILAHLRTRGGGAGLGDPDDELALRPAAPAASPAPSSAALVEGLREVALAAGALSRAARARAG